MTAFCITNYDAICNLGNNIDEIFENAISGKDCFLENDNDFIKGKSFYFGKVAPLDVSIQDEAFYTKTNKMLAYLAKRMNLSKVIDKYGAENVAVVIATTNSGSEEFSQNHNEKLSQIGNPANFLQNFLSTKNYVSSVSTACSSGIKVFSTAKRLLDAGVCKVAIVGGSDELSHLSVHGFNSLEILSDEVSVPFSKNRKGINIGEGAALFVLEKSNDGIEIKGIGETSDAYHASKPEPDGIEIVNAIKKALFAANLSPKDIDYINLHGTGTVANDESEAKAVWQIFGDSVYCSSTKPITGHCLGAAAAIETALCCKMLSCNIILKHRFDRCFDESLPKIKLADKNQKFGVNIVMNNAFGFGGTNAVMILGGKND